MLKKLILVGGGGHCKSCIEVINSTQEYTIVGILDHPTQMGNSVLGVDVIGTDDDISTYINQDYYFLITVGQIESSSLRQKLFNLVKSQGGKLATIQAQTAYVASSATIGEGSIVMHSTFINAGCSIGENNIINTGAILEHDVEVGNHNHISTKAAINGDCKIGNANFIGSSSCIIQGTEMANEIVIGAGSLVLNNILEKGVYAGVPSKKIIE